MPQPPAYTITKDFSDDEANSVSGRSTVLTASLDTELVNIKAFIDQMRTNIGLIQADDGTIKDDAVDLPTLADNVINYITTNGNGWYGADTGAVNAMAVTLSPAPTALTNGMFVVSDIKLTNTATAVTLNVNSLGAKTVVTDGAGTAPSIGALTIGTFYGFQYDSSADKFQIVFSGDSITHSTNAANSATAAATSEANAATSYDNFDDRYLGQKSADVSVNNDGDALVTGALYFNTSNNVMMVYSGSAWQRTTPTSSDQTKINNVNTNISSVNTCSTNISSINTVSTNITDVVAVANDLAEAVSEVVTVADDLNEATSEIDVVANNIANVNLTGGAIANVNLTGGSIANVNTVAGQISPTNNISTLAGLNTEIGALGAITSDITTCSTNSASISTTATNIAGVNSFAQRYRVSSTEPSSDNDAGDLYFNTTTNELRSYGTMWQATAPSAASQANINIVAGDIVHNEDLGSIADALDSTGDEGDITTVANAIANVNTTAGAIANVNTTATNIANVNLTGGSISNINTVGGSIADVNRYAEEYTIASSAPGSPSEGDLWYDSTNNVLKVHNGSSFVAVTSSTAGIMNVVDDTSPELGGDLDVLTRSIVSSSNRDITLAPHGTGKVICGTIDGTNLQLDFGSIA